MTQQERERVHPIQIRVTQQELEELKRLAKLEHRSLASYIIWFILYREKGEVK